VDALGNPVRLELSPGQTHEMKLAPTMLAGVHDANVIGDRAYDAKALAEQLTAQRCTVVIPSNPTRASQRAYDKHLYRERALVEIDQPWCAPSEVVYVPPLLGPVAPIRNGVAAATVPYHRLAA
jgi:transposase